MKNIKINWPLIAAIAVCAAAVGCVILVNNYYTFA